MEVATASDIPALLPLMERLAGFEHYRDSFAVTAEVLYQQGFARPPAFYCLMARHADGYLGGLLWYYYFIPFAASTRPTLFIKELLVEEAYRDQGLGEALMRAAAQTARIRAARPCARQLPPGTKPGGAPTSAWARRLTLFG